MEVQPICWTEHGILYASDYAANHLGMSIETANAGVRVTVKPNDLLLMLDSSWWSPERFDALHAQVAATGGEVVWMVYDLIPLLVPHTCDPVMPPVFRGWLEHAAATADGFVCISEATQQDLERFLDEQPAHPVARPWTRAMHLGSDLESGQIAGQASDAIASLLEGLGARPLVLAIGTVEPRKDYATILTAFETIWARGGDVALAIVGKHGWNVEELVQKLQAHPQLGTRLLSANTGSLPEVVHDPRCLFNPHDIDAAASLLEAALEDVAFREVLVSGVKAHAWTYNWKSCAESALAAMRTLAGDAKAMQPQFGKVDNFDRVRVTQEDIDAWSGLLIDAPDAVGHLEQGLAAAAARGRRRILVDVSEVVRLDARSGVQRVVRNYCAGLHALADEVGVEVQPICWTEHGILYASDYAANHLGMSIETANAGVRVTVKPNDLLLMLDSSWWSPERFDALHAQVAATGGEVVWMVYDLIPLLVPHTCDPVMPPVFRGWLEHAAATADGFVCISEATQQDLERFLDEQPAHPVARPWTRAMHLGSDLESGQIAGQASDAIASLLEGLGARPLVLAIGTVEPRKDYATILTAFETIWARGGDVALAIVGKHGWNVEELVQKLQAHPQLGTRLFWLQGVSDTDLHHLMDRVDVLVQASVAEGFGLPVVEAGSRGKPLLLSDLAVFREIAGEEASYFPVGDADALAAEIERGVALGWKVPTNIRTLTWRESSRGLMEKLLY